MSFAENMSAAFHLVDLVSQAGAVNKLLAAKTDGEKLAWLASHGKLEILPTKSPEAKQAYRFESAVGREAVFFFAAGELVFVGDHVTFTGRDK